MKIISSKYVLAFFLLIIITCADAQKIKPAFHLIKGQTYNMISSGTSVITQSISGKEHKINLSIVLHISFKITGITDTIYNMKVSYNSIDMKIKMADTSFDMNSNTSDSLTKKTYKLDTPSRILSQMIKNPFNITLSKNGKVLSVENMDKMIGGAFVDFPLIDPVRKEQIKSQFVQSFGESAFKISLEAGVAIFPKYPVGKNDKWKMSSTLESPARADVQTYYQMTDITKDFYQVHGDGVIAGSKDLKPGNINGLPVKYDLEGSSVTDIKLDRKTGWITEVKLKQLIEGTMEIMDSPKSPGGMKIPLLFNTTLITTDK